MTDDELEAVIKRSGCGPISAPNEVSMQTHKSPSLFSGGTHAVKFVVGKLRMVQAAASVCVLNQPEPGAPMRVDLRILCLLLKEKFKPGGGAAGAAETGLTRGQAYKCIFRFLTFDAGEHNMDAMFDRASRAETV